MVGWIEEMLKSRYQHSIKKQRRENKKQIHKKPQISFDFWISPSSLHFHSHSLVHFLKGG